MWHGSDEELWFCARMYEPVSSSSKDHKAPVSNCFVNLLIDFYMGSRSEVRASQRHSRLTTGKRGSWELRKCSDDCTYWNLPTRFIVWCYFWRCKSDSGKQISKCLPHFCVTTKNTFWSCVWKMSTSGTTYMYIWLSSQLWQKHWMFWTWSNGHDICGPLRVSPWTPFVYFVCVTFGSNASEFYCWLSQLCRRHSAIVINVPKWHQVNSGIVWLYRANYQLDEPKFPSS